jgi:predicted solute-binding protein
LEAALLPVFEIFQISRPRVVDGISISCLGPVKSVIVASPGQLSETSEIYPDPASVTSNSLLKILLAEFFPKPPKVITTSQPLVIPDHAPRLLIGDRALEFRRTFPDWHFFDLGECWHKNTGLPFVFAAWCLSPPAPESLPDRLRTSRTLGLSNLSEIANTTPTPDESLDYLSRNIRYGLGDQEKTALRLFASLAFNNRLLKKVPEIDWT